MFTIDREACFGMVSGLTLTLIFGFWTAIGFMILLLVVDWVIGRENRRLEEVAGASDPALDVCEPRLTYDGNSEGVN